MARQIIIISQTRSPAGDTVVRAAFWLAVPANLQVPVPTFLSAVPLVAAAPAYGVTSAELAALQSGTVLEQTIDSGQLPASVTPAQVAAGLVTRFNAAQTALNNQAASKTYAGASWDGSAWSNLPA